LLTRRVIITSAHHHRPAKTSSDLVNHRVIRGDASAPHHERVITHGRNRQTIRRTLRDDKHAVVRTAPQNTKLRPSNRVRVRLTPPVRQRHPTRGALPRQVTALSAHRNTREVVQRNHEPGKRPEPRRQVPERVHRTTRRQTQPETFHRRNVDPEPVPQITLTHLHEFEIHRVVPPRGRSVQPHPQRRDIRRVRTRQRRTARDDPRPVPRLPPEQVAGLKPQRLQNVLTLTPGAAEHEQTTVILQRQEQRRPPVIVRGTRHKVAARVLLYLREPRQQLREVHAVSL